MAMHRLNVNGRVRELDADSDMPLLWALRDKLGLTGTKFGCGVGVCGACTVLVDGVALRSCQVAVAEAAGPSGAGGGGVVPPGGQPPPRPPVGEGGRQRGGVPAPPG